MPSQNPDNPAGRPLTCPKCGSTSGDDWTQCRGACPMPGSPHYSADPAPTQTTPRPDHPLSQWPPPWHNAAPPAPPIWEAVLRGRYNAAPHSRQFHDHTPSEFRPAPNVAHFTSELARARERLDQAHNRAMRDRLAAEMKYRRALGLTAILGALGVLGWLLALWPWLAPR